MLYLWKITLFNCHRYRSDQPIFRRVQLRTYSDETGISLSNISGGMVLFSYLTCTCENITRAGIPALVLNDHPLLSGCIPPELVFDLLAGLFKTVSYSVKAVSNLIASCFERCLYGIDPGLRRGDDVIDCVFPENNAPVSIGIDPYVYNSKFILLCGLTGRCGHFVFSHTDGHRTQVFWWLTA